MIGRNNSKPITIDRCQKVGNDVKPMNTNSFDTGESKRDLPTKSVLCLDPETSETLNHKTFVQGNREKQHCHSMMLRQLPP